MKALILAAGYATRLYPLTKEYPKPLLKVGKRPIIDYIVDKINRIDDINEVLVVTNSKFFYRFRQWLRTVKSNKHIDLIDDLTKSHSDRRGAIGDINFAIEKERIRDDLLVIGGDNLFADDLLDFLSFAKDKRSFPIIGVYDIKYRSKARNYGVVKLGADNRIIEFQEKPKSPKSTFVAMCLYYFPKRSLQFIRDYLKNKINKHDATGFYIEWLRKKFSVYGFIFSGCWYDIGSHRFYDEAKEVFVEQ